MQSSTPSPNRTNDDLLVAAPDTDADWATHFDTYSTVYDADAFAGAGLAHLSKVELRPLRRLLRDTGTGVMGDLGCGTGRIARVGRDAGFEVWGFDASEKMAELALADQAVQRFDAGDLRDGIPWADGTVDVVTCLRVLKYIADWEPVLAEMRRVVRNQGRAFIEVTNARSFARWGYGDAPITLRTDRQARAAFEGAGWQVDRCDMWTALPHPLWRRATKPAAVTALNMIDSTVIAGAQIVGGAPARSLLYTLTARS
jgi:SAM-dependent methyltransferase